MRCDLMQLLEKHLNKAGDGGSMTFFALPKAPPPPTLGFYRGVPEASRCTCHRLEAPGSP